MQHAVGLGDRRLRPLEHRGGDDPELELHRLVLEPPGLGPQLLPALGVHQRGRQVGLEAGAEQLVDDLVADRRVAARERAHEVGPRDDADETSVLHDREPVDSERDHRAGRLRDGAGGLDGDRRRGHRLAGRVRTELREIGRARGLDEPGEQAAGPLGRPALLHEQVRLAQHAHDHTVRAADRQA